MIDVTLDDDFEIRVRFVAPLAQRYDTTDDYFMDQGQLVVLVSKEGSFSHKMAILLHSLVEWAVAREDGVPTTKIDDWDFSHTDSPEPGAEPGCPYGRAHHIAYGVEMAFRSLTGTPHDISSSTENVIGNSETSSSSS